MEQATIYLQKLRFDEKLKRSFIAKYFANPRLVLLLIVSILAFGISSYMQLPRRLNPEIKIPIVIVSTVLPGANPQDIESLITEPLESSINAVTNIKSVSSTSQNNVSVISIEFNASVDTDKARADIQSAVDQVQLPSDAQNPTVNTIDFENQPVWSFAVIGPNPASLSRLADTLKTNLENKSTIKEVQTSGIATQEVAVTVSPDKVAAYGVNPLQLSQQIKAAAGSFPAGNINTDTLTFPLSVDPAISSVDDVRALQINNNGNIIPLGSIATIQQISKPNTFDSFFASTDIEPTSTVTFNVYKTTTTNIDKAVADSESVVHDTLQNYGDQFQIKSIVNTGELIDEQFNELIRDFSITILLVFVVLFVFLGARQAFVSLFAVPLTFLITFIVMHYMGVSLNFLSMFSLLLSLGLLVDDTIVVISAMTSYFRTGKFTLYETGLLVWRDFGIAILTTTLTTVWAFLPLLLATGIIGEFIKSIPIVVSSTLIASLFVAMIITLPLMIILLKPSIPRRVHILLRVLLAVALAAVYIVLTPKGPFFIVEIFGFFIFLFVIISTRDQLVERFSVWYSRNKARTDSFVHRTAHYSENGIISFSRIDNLYRRGLVKILAERINRRNTIIIVLLFSFFSYLLVPLGFVKNEFFPKSDQEYLYMNLELPSGTNLETTRLEAEKLLTSIRQTPDVEYVTLDLAQSFNATGFGGGNSGENTALFSLVLPKKSERKLSSIDIAELLRNKYSNYTKGKLTVAEVSGGPPAGSDIQIKLFGDDLATLDTYADKITHYLESQKGAADIQKSIKSGTSKLVFTPDAQKMAYYNVTQDQLGLWLRTFASGFTLETIKFPDSGNDDLDITLRLGDKTQQVEDIYALEIPTPQGTIPLTNLGSLEMKPNPTLITRENGKRTLSVTATVRPGFSITDINQQLESFAKDKLNLPTGYSWQTGGVNEQNQESVNSIFTAMILSFLLIVITMVIQFGSFRKAIIVMLVIPLSISGVFIIFGLTQTPLSFPALIGVLALFGIVVKNSILIVDKITANQEIGMNFTDSIVDGAVSRLEAIALTSITAIIGLIPITLSNPLWRGLGGAIIAGLTFSGTIMLFFIPVVYYYWFKPTVKREGVRVKGKE